MKSIIVFPPQWHPATPYLSVPLLVGQLESAGFDVEGWDLNVEFYNDYLCRKQLLLSINKIEQIISNKDYFLNSDNPYEKEKYTKCLDYISLNESKIKKAINHIEEAINILKTNNFYNPSLFLKAKKIISYALDIISLPYYPTHISLSDYKNDELKQDFPSLLNSINNYETNIYIDYFKKKIKEKITAEVGFVGISVTHYCQLVGAFTLAKLLKEMTNVKVCLGGNLVTRISEEMVSNSSLLPYFDYILTGNGEISIVDLVKTIEKKGDYSQISGLIYKKDKLEIIKNPIQKIKSISTFSPLSFTGYDLSKYFIPQIIIPIQLSKGCYWGKCSFCDFFYGKEQYITKKISAVVDEIKFLNNKYGINNFEFVDDSIPPQYYETLSDAFIENDLNINFYSMARAEKDFSTTILQKMYNAGCKFILWGLESSSQRVLDTMNKGIDIHDSEKVLVNAANIGFWNHSYFILGFPTETLDEMAQTKNYILNSHSFIDSFSAQKFTLNKHSKIFQNLSAFNLDNVNVENIGYSQNIDCIYDLNFSKCRDSLLSDITKFYFDKKALPLWKFLYPDEYLFLYLLKYNKSYVKNFIVNQNI